MTSFFSRDLKIASNLLDIEEIVKKLLFRRISLCILFYLHENKIN